MKKNQVILAETKKNRFIHLKLLLTKSPASVMVSGVVHVIPTYQFSQGFRINGTRCIDVFKVLVKS